MNASLRPTAARTVVEPSATFATNTAPISVPNSVQALRNTVCNTWS